MSFFSICADNLCLTRARHAHPQPPSPNNPPPQPRSPDAGLERGVKKGARLLAIHHIRLTRPTALKRPRLSLTPWHSHRHLPLDAHTQPRTLKHTYRQSTTSLQSLQNVPSPLVLSSVELSSPSISAHHSQKCQHAQQMALNRYNDKRQVTPTGTNHVALHSQPESSYFQCWRTVMQS